MDNYHDKMTKLLPGDDTISLKDSQVSPCLILNGPTIFCNLFMTRGNKLKNLSLSKRLSSFSIFDSFSMVQRS